MNANVTNLSSPVHQEVHKIFKDEIARIEAEDSLDKITVWEKENDLLLRAVVSQDIMSIVQNPPVVESSDLQTEIERVDNTAKTKRPQSRCDNRIDNIAKTRRPQPRSNIKNDRVPSASKSSCIKYKEVKVEDHHRNLLLSKNKKHMSSEFSSSANQKKHKAKVKKPKKSGSNESLTTPKPRKPRTCLRWSPNGRTFDLKGKLIESSDSEYQSDNSKDDNVVQICLWCVDLGCSKHMTRNLKLLINFIWNFLGTFRFGNDHIAAILSYGDLQWGNILITMVYFVEGLGNNLFLVGQFCDSDLENYHDDIRKFGAKCDIGFFIGYSANSCAYRVYNRRTRQIMETMNVTFDELSAMAYNRRDLPRDTSTDRVEVLRVMLFSIHSDDGNPSSVNIKQLCGRLVPSCFVIYDLELLSLSFNFIFLSEIFKSLSFRLDRLYRLAILYLDQHVHTLHHLESLLTIFLDRLDIFEGRSCISEFVRNSLSLILELS
ncbi:hypothetical protein Tco_0348704 [Tanacetum coccineum]